MTTDLTTLTTEELREMVAAIAADLEYEAHREKMRKIMGY